jgi:hypothetical protein
LDRICPTHLGKLKTKKYKANMKTEFVSNAQDHPSRETMLAVGHASGENHGAPLRPNSEWVLDVEPWPEPVEGNILLDQLSRVFTRFVVLPKWGAETLALWTLHTYAFQLRDVTAYLGIESPLKRCGKSTLLTVLSKFVNRPVVSSNISPPAFFCVIEETQPTLLIDEADRLLRGNDELKGILNSGYSRTTAYVVRVAHQLPTRDSASVNDAEHATREAALSGPSTLDTRPSPPRPASPGSPAGAPKPSPPSATCPKPSPTAASFSACTARPPASNANGLGTCMWTRSGASAPASCSTTAR